eukprot:2281951-Pleurochrysis_carterae.AAC.2
MPRSKRKPPHARNHGNHLTRTAHRRAVVKPTRHGCDDAQCRVRAATPTHAAARAHGGSRRRQDRTRGEPRARAMRAGVA